MVIVLQSKNRKIEKKPMIINNKKIFFNVKIVKLYIKYMCPEHLRIHQYIDCVQTATSTEDYCTYSLHT